MDIPTPCTAPPPSIAVIEKATATPHNATSSHIYLPPEHVTSTTPTLICPFQPPNPDDSIPRRQNTRDVSLQERKVCRIPAFQADRPKSPNSSPNAFEVSRSEGLSDPSRFKRRRTAPPTGVARLWGGAAYPAAAQSLRKGLAVGSRPRAGHFAAMPALYASPSNSFLATS